ncbi:hypothetical protein FQA47_016240 [Oryzias melastigma]|uniref:Uncharacterized protein n=1 Tax=Oryzias melastigma TaxID=30732 RepID=A0A834C7Q7_ORYME|nr:hypothetical protein FQA47_016240 [Oryzias melastigma]
MCETLSKELSNHISSEKPEKLVQTPEKNLSKYTLHLEFSCPSQTRFPLREGGAAQWDEQEGRRCSGAQTTPHLHHSTSCLWPRCPADAAGQTEPLEVCMHSLSPQ